MHKLKKERGAPLLIKERRRKEKKQKKRRRKKINLPTPQRKNGVFICAER